MNFLLSENKRGHFFTFLLISLVLFVFESYVPRPIPWLKLGLANIMVVMAFPFFSSVEVLKLVVYRVLIGAIFLGTIGSPTFLLSLAGGISAWFIMTIIYKYITKDLVILSVHGGVFHYIGQVVVAYLLFIKSEVIFYLLPYLIIGGSITGFIIGFLSDRLVLRFKDHSFK